MHPILLVDVPFKKGGVLRVDEDAPKSWIKGPFEHRYDVMAFRRVRGF